MDYILIETKAYEKIKQRLTDLTQQVNLFSRTFGEKKAGQWLDSQEVCLALGISKRTLQYYRSIGTVPYSFIGNKIYYKAEIINALLAKAAVKPNFR